MPTADKNPQKKVSDNSRSNMQMAWRQENEVKEKEKMSDTFLSYL
jgi:hypothetical protein